ncbi:MAG: topoisomerase DNA-binding C4 zinc finger domain-containing protein, partial [Actinomycetota bacterium]|nr:topoisomerase DNA-binding C4 zinc finger domain-containing protein [Actinomycetota bacterium]
CPEEGREPGQLAIKLGRAGKFVGCSNWPECSYTRDLSGQVRPEPELLEETCPDCGRQLVRRVGRYGPFTGCSGYPDCRYIKREEKGTGITCPKCGQGELVQKRARRRGRSVFYGCNRYPDCDFTVGQRPVADPCPRCQSLMVSVAEGVRCTSCGYESGQGGGPTEAA